jgi:hypothetical protein
MATFLAVAVFFLFTEHRAHLFGLLPYVLLAACPVMHLVMHRKHREPHHHADRERAAEREASR